MSESPLKRIIQIPKIIFSGRVTRQIPKHQADQHEVDPYAGILLI